MTLADDILRYGLKCDPQLIGHDPESYNLWATPRYLERWIRQATIVNIQNVAEFYYQNLYDLKSDGCPTSNFPAVIPPWDLAFFEFKVTPTIMKNLSPTFGDHFRMYRWGLLWARLGEFETDIFQIEEHRPNYFAAEQRFTIQWNPDGTLINNFLCACAWSEAAQFTFESLDSLGVNASLLAVSLSHCKNVSIKEEQTPPALAKAYTKRTGGMKPFRYHVLNIDPMKKAIRAERSSAPAGQNELTTALHICRGHFKDYRESGGLFGKHKGLFWWDMHVKGSAENGVVDKGYNVKAPRP